MENVTTQPDSTGRKSPHRFGGAVRVLLLALTDIVCLSACWALAVWGYRALGPGHYKYGAEFYLRLWPVLVAFSGINAMFRLYHGNMFYPAAPVNPVEELRRLVISSFIAHTGVIAALALAYQSTENYSRAVIVISGALAAVAAQPFRNAARRLMRLAGIGQIPIAVIGEGETADRIAAALDDNDYMGFKVVDPAESPSIAVVCRDIRLLRQELAALTRIYTHVIFFPSGEAFPSLGAQVVSVDGIGGLEMVNQRRMRFLRFEKWILDRTLAVVAFVLLSPFFVVIPLLIKLTSRGPVFYRQPRLGRDGRPIRVWKFRSMYADADARLKSLLDSNPALAEEWARSFKLHNDPRVTPLGRFLRKTSIDEFPQLLNVLAGDMALVGPRPIVEKEVPLYGKAYELFSSVAPGVTGLWQATGRSDTDYARRVALDTYYVLNWSPWLDVWILFRTVGAVVFMRGAR